MINHDKFRRCPICGGPNPKLYLKATSAPPKVPSQIQVTEKYFGLHGDLVKCPKCGFIYVGRELFTDKVARLYKRMSDQAYTQEEKERRRSFIRIIKTIEDLNHDKGGNILDIGCCTGALLAEAKVRGFAPYGVDPSIWACKMAKKMHGLDIYNGTLDKYNYPAGYFEAITLIDVFEHVKNPKSTLLKVHKLLGKKGVFCLVSPDYGSIAAKILGKRWWGIRLAHLSYFKWRDLVRLFKNTGFKIAKRKTYIRFFSLYYILVRLLPIIERREIIKSLLKKITLPLVFFDTFELYLVKA